MGFGRIVVIELKRLQLMWLAMMHMEMVDLTHIMFKVHTTRL